MALLKSSLAGAVLWKSRLNVSVPPTPKTSVTMMKYCVPDVTLNPARDWRFVPAAMSSLHATAVKAEKVGGLLVQTERIVS